MNEVMYFGKVNEGVLHITHRKFFDQDMGNIFEGKEVEIRVRRKIKRRTDSQNRYYWGGVIPSVQAGLKDAGMKWTRDKIHRNLCAMFLKEVEANEVTGETLETVKSTTELSTTEFGEYIMDIQQWASEFLGIVIPDPETQAQMFEK